MHGDRVKLQCLTETVVTVQKAWVPVRRRLHGSAGVL